MFDPVIHLSEDTKNVVDAVSIATVIGTMSDLLPTIAAGFTIVWTIIRIYESKTIQGWLAKWNNKRGTGPHRAD